jgi:hypothetical protein
VKNLLFIAGIMGNAKMKSVDGVWSLNFKLGFGEDNRWAL